eukprot:1270179-Pleurochrysis_carterae.AAC.2
MRADGKGTLSRGASLRAAGASTRISALGLREMAGAWKGDSWDTASLSPARFATAHVVLWRILTQTCELLVPPQPPKDKIEPSTIATAAGVSDEDLLRCHTEDLLP